VATPPLAPALSTDEVVALQRLKLERDVEDALLHWAKSRFWWGAFAILLIGFFGVRGFIRELVSTELAKATAATAKADIAADQTLALTKELRADAGQYRTIVGDLRTSAEAVDGSLSQLQKRMDELGSRIEAEGSHAIVAADHKIAAVAQQVNQLSELVKTIARENHESRQALREYDARIEALGRSTERSREDFTMNSDYIVYVAAATDPQVKGIADYLVRELAQLGYKTSRFTWSGKPDSDKLTVFIDYAPKDDALAQRVATAVAKLLRQRRVDHIVKLRETDQSRNIIWLLLA
jgi:uncharacterized protein YukE